MNKHQRHNSQLAKELSDMLSDITESYLLGLIDGVDYIKRTCTITQAIKADISVPNENWAIIRKSNDEVIIDLFTDAMEASEKLRTWSNKEQFKIDKI